MRFHALLAAFAATGAVAEIKIGFSQQKGEAVGNVIRIPDQHPAALVAWSSGIFHSLSIRKTNLQVDYDGILTPLSKREDGEDDDDDDDDNDRDEDDEKDRHRPNVAAVAGGVVGGVILLLLLLFFLFWFKIRPRRQNRRRKRDEEEEDGKRKEEEELANGHAVGTQRPYEPIPNDEPPHYQQVVAAVPRATASSPPPSILRGTTDFPAELPSPVDDGPVDGREPSPLPPPSALDFSKEFRGPQQQQQTQITIHPEERSSRVY